ncbi:hypothetical protein KIH39_20895 [Telmatocola sphagniphila]|jgi:hypothetical protein|uniref:Uncharacterized protein n=1 Tax=Telmatocola sphagniphila TaxID=1123043 RepID=A0A8E6B6G0_9BACT|nr:hypothetical protein [Telmatocola sphagniphila]QVL31280.1 hypothetical protein KIH39_20895 [Telmatocola sphagniphila]
MSIKGYLYLGCVVVAVTMSSKVATRGGGPGTWSILLAALGGLTLLLILDLWGFIQQQDSDKRTVSKRKSRKRRMKDSGQNFT